jgi:hypothetical protein
VLAKVSFDRGLEVDQRAEGAASQAPAGERGEKALDAVRPGARSGLEMKCPARVPGEPGRYLIRMLVRMLVDGVVVEDRMNQPTRCVAAPNVFDGGLIGPAWLRHRHQDSSAFLIGSKVAVSVGNAVAALGSLGERIGRNRQDVGTSRSRTAGSAL